MVRIGAVDSLIAFLLARREMAFQLLVEPLADSRRDLKCSFVPHELDYVPCAVQDGAAASTVLEMSGHCGAEPRVHFIVKIV